MQDSGNTTFRWGAGSVLGFSLSMAACGGAYIPMEEEAAGRGGSGAGVAVAGRASVGDPIGGTRAMGGSMGGATSTGMGSGTAGGLSCGGPASGISGSGPYLGAPSDVFEEPDLDIEADAPWLAFDSNASGKRQVYLLELAAPEDTIQLESDFNDFEPAFSPDGNWLAFTSDREGTPQVFVMDLATREVTQLTHEEAGASQPSFFRNGHALLARRGPVSTANPSLTWDHSTDSAILKVTVPEGNTSLVACGHEWASFEHPVAGPDGRVLVDRYNTILELTPTVTRPVVQDSTTRIETPSISLDGNLVAYSIMCDPVMESIWLTPLEQSATPCNAGGTRITPVGAPFSRRPALRDAQTLAFEQGDTQADIIVWQDGAFDAIVAWPSDERNPTWSIATPALE